MSDYDPIEEIRKAAAMITSLEILNAIEDVEQKRRLETTMICAPEQYDVIYERLCKLNKEYADTKLRANSIVKPGQVILTDDYRIGQIFDMTIEDQP